MTDTQMQHLTVWFISSGYVVWPAIETIMRMSYGEGFRTGWDRAIRYRR